MPRTKIEPHIIPGAYNDADGVEIIFTACDEANGNYCRLSGGEVLAIRGEGLFTVTSVPDGIGRTGDLTRTLAGTEDMVLLGPFPVAGFGQSNGTLWFDGVAEVEVAVLSPNR